MPKTRNNKNADRKKHESGDCELPSCQLSVIATQHNDRIAVSCRLKHLCCFYVSNDNDNENDQPTRVSSKQKSNS